jgi:hypothetical protein
VLCRDSTLLSEYLLAAALQYVVLNDTSMVFEENPSIIVDSFPGMALEFHYSLPQQRPMQ